MAAEFDTFRIESQDFFTSYDDDEVCSSFDAMSLQENLLRGIYKYGFVKPLELQERNITPFVKYGGDMYVSDHRENFMREREREKEDKDALLECINILRDLGGAKAAPRWESSRFCKRQHQRTEAVLQNVVQHRGAPRRGAVSRRYASKAVRH